MTTTNVREALAELVSKALNRTWSLGQTYWQQADSPSYKENARSDTTRGIYEALREQTLAAIASHPSPAPQGAEPMAQAQVERDSVARWSVWWNHKRKTFTTTRQAALAAWHAALSTPSPEPREPAQPAPEQGEAVAWLIERKASRFGPAAWWAGCGPHFNIDDDRCWTQDANMAIKFVDAQSARHAQWTLLRMAHQTARDHRVEVTEHCWPAPQPAPEKAEAAPLRRGVTGVCARSTCECEGAGLGDQCIWLRPTHPEQKAEAAVPAGWAIETGVGGFSEKGDRWVCVRNLESQCGQDFYEDRDPLIFNFLMKLAPTGITPTEGQA